MTSKITYLGDLRTQAIHIKSGEQIITDAPTDNNGKGEAFSPTDLVATALGSCMITVMGIWARNHQVNIDQAELEITKIMAPGPRRISQIDVLIRMPNHPYSSEEKKKLEHLAKTCPVALSLHADIIQQIEFLWTHEA
ncbi:MAG: OsmC family protein [Saprospiraceae bacterium]|nr:OsmC family protein [Saprospiraceae bacterium]